MADISLTGSCILDNGRTPEERSTYLSERGIQVQPDTIRKAANESGARFTVFGSVVITSEQMDKIIQERTTCPSGPKDVATSGKRTVALNTTAGQLHRTSGSALDQLRKQAHGTGSEPTRKGKSVVTSLERKRNG